MSERGRPSKYDPAFVEQAAKLCALGATDEQIADFFGVAPSTLYLWKHGHPEFSEALKAGKAEADERVVRSLYQRAVGYEFDGVKVFMPAGAAAPVYAPIRERLHPDTTAAIFWLKNRRPEEWRDKLALGGDPDNPIKHEHAASATLAALLEDIAGRKGG